MSSDKKLIYELSDEDLIRLIEGVKLETIMEKVSEAAKFLYALKIKHGDEKITAQLVYYTYKQYKGWDNKLQNKAQFFKDFNTYFTPKRDQNGMYYLLDPKPFDLSEENFWIMKAAARREKAKKTKKS